jgi:AcrR family transcriptional regulator
MTSVWDRPFHLPTLLTTDILVIATSNVAKRTFYKHFPSKDQLILEVMLYREKQWLQWFEKSVELRGKTATEKLLVVQGVNSVRV